MDIQDTSNNKTTHGLEFTHYNQDNITQIPPEAAPKWEVLLPFGFPASGASVSIVKVNDDIRRDFLVSDDHFDYPLTIFETTTLDDGSFEIINLPPDTYLFHAELDGYSPGHIYIDLRENRPESILINLGLCKNVIGCVTDIENKPMTDITVEVSLPYLPYSNLLSMSPAEAIDLLRFHGITKTDITGRFCVPDQPLRNLYLTIEDNLGKHARVLRIIPESDFSEHKIILRRKCTLEGFVKDNNNKPISNVEIWDITFENGMASNSPHCAFSDKKGFFKFENTREGNVYIHATHPKYGGFGQYTNIQFNTKNTLNIVLHDAIANQIIVTDTNNNPIKDIDIILEDSTTGVVLSQGKTDKKGFYRADSLIPGNIIIVTANSAKSNRDYSCASDTFFIRDDDNLAVQLTPLFTFTFNIIDGVTNTLIPNVYIYLTEGSSVYSEYSYAQDIEPLLCKEGKASWAIALNTFYTLHVVADNYEPKSVDLFFNKNNINNNIIDITLNKGAFYCGTLVDSISNSPISGAIVSLNLTSSKSMKSLISSNKTHCVFTDNNGHFNINALPLGYFSLSIIAPGYSKKTISSHLLKPGTNPLINIIHIEPSATITGKLHIDQNRPIESGIVELMSSSNELINKAHTAVDGTYTINNVPPGKYYLHASDYAMTSITNWQTYLVKEILVSSNNINNVDFLFSGTASIFGSCKVDNQPGVGFLIKLLNINDNSIRFLTSSEEEGLFLIHSVISGEYTISATSTMDGIGCSISKNITVNANTQLICDFEFTDFTMAGKIVNISGKEICGCSVTVSDNINRTYHAFTDHGGRFTFYNIPHGNYTLSATHVGFSSISEYITISNSINNYFEYTIKPEGILKIYVNNKSYSTLKPLVISLDSHDKIINPDVVESNQIIHTKLPEGVIITVIGGQPFSPYVIKSNIISGQTYEKNISLIEGGYIVLKAITCNGSPAYGANVQLDQTGLYGISWEFLQKNNFINVDPSNFTISQSGEFKIGPLPPGTYTFTIALKTLQWSKTIDVTGGHLSSIKATLR